MRIIVLFLAFLQCFSGCLAAVVGLDFGTHYAKEMVVSLKAPLEIVLNPESKRKDASALAIRPWADQDYLERYYGTSAMSLAARFPSMTFMHLKSLLGKHYEDNLFHYHKEHPGLHLVKDGSRNSIAFPIGDGESTLSVEELVGMSLRQYVERANHLLAENHDSDSVRSVSFAIPEYFNQAQRLSLLDAARLGKIRQPYLVNDAIAVAIDYASKKRSFEPGKKHHYVIYDMGAGSTTASLVSILQPEDTSLPLNIEFLGYGHTEALSGSTLTLAIYDILENQFLQAHPEIRTHQFESDHSAKTRLVQAAEKAKLMLSANSEAPVSVESLFNDLDFKTTVTRAAFEEYVADSRSLVIEPIFTALKTSFENDGQTEKLTVKDLDSVILTGGSTRVPFVKEQLEEHFGSSLISKNVNSDESAVHGAAIRGVQLSAEFKTKPMNITDRTTHAFAVTVQGTNEQQVVFNAGSVYPKTTTLQLPGSGSGSGSDSKTNTLHLELLEDEKAFKNIDIQVDSKIQVAKLNNCSSEVNYNVTLSLDSNQIFDVDEVVAWCSAPKVQESNENKDNDTDSSAATLPTEVVVKQVIPFTAEYTNVKPLTEEEKLERLNKLNKWDQKDKIRLERQRLLNDLESSLYAARELLDDASELEHPPNNYIKQLESIIEEYLETLNEPSAIKTKDIKDMKQNLAKRQEKLETYIKYSNEALDDKQFEQLLKQGDALLEKITSIEKKKVEDLFPLAENFESLGLNVTSEYFRVKPPKSKVVPESLVDKVVDKLHSQLEQIKELLDGELSEYSREELLDNKLNLDVIYTEVEKIINRITAEHKYRLKLLQSVYERRLLASKQAEEHVDEPQNIKPEDTHSNKNSTDDTREEKEKKGSEQVEFEQDEL